MHPSVEKILRISQIPGLGVGTYWRLVEAFGGVEQLGRVSCEALRAVVDRDLARAIGAKTRSATDELAAITLDWCAANDVHLISHLDPRYPSRLREIKRGPPLLYVRGELACLTARQLAIVGSRSASRAGKNNAFAVARDLAQQGLAITSGLALGIDTQAHLGALSGEGQTLAVVGSGIDRVYPHRNRALVDEILAAGGAIISEFPLKTAPAPENFPRRNRIISGLSVGTLVIEAAVKSGSLITARYALEQNREVFAMPGSVHNPLSRGCHALIKQGAVLVENATDIITELSGFVATRTGSDEVTGGQEPDADLSSGEMAVLSHLEHEPCSLELLAERSAIAVPQLLADLMSLELLGLVANDSGRYSLTTNIGSFAKG